MAHVPVTIRVAHVRDLPLLIEIERLAGSVFRSLGMDLVADDDPGSANDSRLTLRMAVRLSPLTPPIDLWGTSSLMPSMAPRTSNK